MQLASNSIRGFKVDLVSIFGIWDIFCSGENVNIFQISSLCLDVYEVDRVGCRKLSLHDIDKIIGDINPTWIKAYVVQFVKQKGNDKAKVVTIEK